jgi:hypothetical protein
MAEATCSTCALPLQACRCPPPPVPDTLSRVVALEAARMALLHAVMATPQQHDPTVRTAVDAEIARLRAADEATIHRLAQAAGLVPYRQRQPIVAPAEFWGRYYALRQAFFAKQQRWPTLTETATELGIGRRTLYRYLHPTARRKKSPGA